MSEALCVLSQVFGASCCDHFLDDYMDISPAFCSILPSDSTRQHVNNSQWFPDELHTLIGFPETNEWTHRLHPRFSA